MEKATKPCRACSWPIEYGRLLQMHLLPKLLLRARLDLTVKPWASGLSTSGYHLLLAMPLLASCHSFLLPSPLSWRKISSGILRWNLMIPVGELMSAQCPCPSHYAEPASSSVSFTRISSLPSLGARSLVSFGAPNEKCDNTMPSSALATKGSTEDSVMHHSETLLVLHFLVS